MTQDEIKKGLEYAAKVTGNGVFAGAYKIITDQEKEIERLKSDFITLECNYDKIYDEHKQHKIENENLKILNNKFRECIDYLKAEVKQAQIDVLNKLKTKKYYVWGCGELLHITEDDIDELIKEIENDKCNC